MSFNVQQFRANLLADGARSSLFEIRMAFPVQSIVGGAIPQTAGSAQIDITFKARATTLPGDSVSQLTLNYFGREIKVAGTRTFPEWTVTVINDEDFLIRNTFEKWMSGINQHVANVRDPDFITGNGGYQVDISVLQFSKAGNATGVGTLPIAVTNYAPIKQYDLIGAFPTDLSPIDLDWGADSIEEFTVTFAYQWWQSVLPVQTTDRL